jgi:cell division protein FtsB
MSKLNSSKILIFGLILILALIVFAFTKESYRKFQISKEVSALLKNIKSLRDKNGDLSNLLNYFNSNESLEKEARLKFNLSKEGEKLVIIGSEGQKNFKNQTSEESKKEISNFKKWQEFLGLDSIFGK